MAEDAASEVLAITTSRHFPAWLAATGVSIAFTTYQAGKLFCSGPAERAAVDLRADPPPRSMGLAPSADGRSLALVTQTQILRSDNVLDPGQTTPDGYDELYAPHAG